MKTIAIVGASGYIGRHVVAQLLQLGSVRVKVLTKMRHDGLRADAWPGEVEVVHGDLHDAGSLRMFLEADCTVVNLVYLWTGGESANLAVTKNLLEACKLAQVRRLIHCSTAAVVGRVSDDNVTEKTVCRPITEYGVTKLKIEKMIIDAARGNFDAAILRPTGVFGPGGVPLSKLAGDLINGSHFRNYLKSCLFGKRRMNLVHISNVVAAILFLIGRSEHLGGDVFIVSDDDCSSNNFADIERVLMRSLGCATYPLPRISLPLGLLRLMLGYLGRNNINPRCNYVQANLQRLGFKSPVVFEDGLLEYAAWYRSNYVIGHGGVAE